MKLSARRPHLAGIAAAAVLAFPSAGPDLPSPAGCEDPVARYEALVQRYEKAQADAKAAQRAAATADEKKAAKALRPKVAEYALEFRDLALEHAGTDAALLCWLKVLELGGEASRGDLVDRASEALVKDHVQSDKLADLPYSGLPNNPDKAEKILRALAEKSPHRIVQGRSLFVLSGVLISRAEDGGQIASVQEAKAMLERVRKDFADVKDTRKKSLGKQAESLLGGLEKLTVGAIAPDIVAKDLNDVEFKLSDYRGKVVMLDFWGNW